LDSKEKNLLIVLGPTGVGKSTTAIKLAQIFPGEIISCDSMQVYKGFNIGTDKIPEEQRAGIPHHLLDIIEPTVQFTAADFIELAFNATKLILAKNLIPIISGGTGLYLKAFLEGLFPEGQKDPNIRHKLEIEAAEQGLAFLYQKLIEVDPIYGNKIGKNDRIRIIRALEVYESTHKPISEHFSRTESRVNEFNIIKIGLELERKELYARIEKRVDRMIELGLFQEVRDLLDSGVKTDLPAFRALGYQPALQYLNGSISQEEAAVQIKKETRHYAKRQITWFKKMAGINWFSPYDFSSLADLVRGKLL